jgi:hypothetical protein
MEDLHSVAWPTSVIFHEAELLEVHAISEARRNPEVHEPRTIHLIHQAAYEHKLQEYLVPHVGLKVHAFEKLVEVPLKVAEERHDMPCNPPSRAYKIHTVRDANVEDHIDHEILTDVLPIVVQREGPALVLVKRRDIPVREDRISAVIHRRYIAIVAVSGCCEPAAESRCPQKDKRSRNEEHSKPEPRV